MLKVMIAEDDLMIADMIDDTLTMNGYEVCGIARTVKEAIKLCKANRPDLALIDFRLAHGDLGTDIIDQLTVGPRIGVLYASGNMFELVARTHGDACLAKPYSMSDLLDSLRIVSAVVATGVATPPFPRSFKLLGEKTSNLRLGPLHV